MVDVRSGDGAGDLAECAHQYRYAFAFLGILVMPVDVESSRATISNLAMASARSP